MEGSFTEKIFEGFGDTAALISLYGSVNQDVEALFKTTPELVGGRDCVVSLVEVRKALNLVMPSGTASI